jgi:hypothetical protein
LEDGNVGRRWVGGPTKSEAGLDGVNRKVDVLRVEKVKWAGDVRCELNEGEGVEDERIVGDEVVTIVSELDGDVSGGEWFDASADKYCGHLKTD